MSALSELAELLGVGERDVGDALKDERAARTALSRRALLMGSAAVAVQSVLPVPKRAYSFIWNNPLRTSRWGAPNLLPYLVPFMPVAMAAFLAAKQP